MALSLRERGEAAALEDCSGEELIRIVPPGAGVFEVFEREALAHVNRRHQAAPQRVRDVRPLESAPRALPQARRPQIGPVMSAFVFGASA